MQIIKNISTNTQAASLDVVKVRDGGKYVISQSDSLAPTDVEEGVRVGVDDRRYVIHVPLAAKIDLPVAMMHIENKPDVTYNSVSGCVEQLKELRGLLNFLCCIRNVSTRQRVSPCTGRQIKEKPYALEL